MSEENGAWQEIIIVAAMAENRVIGKDNSLPWGTIREDLGRFHEMTKGNICIMGRKTYESLPVRPLPFRQNVVLSSNFKSDAKNVKVFPTLKAALQYCKKNSDRYDRVYICGGGMVYEEAMDLADRIELTIIHRTYLGDTYFPVIDKTLWNQYVRTDHGILSFITYIRNAEEDQGA